jgi:hypothetical protein
MMERARRGTKHVVVEMELVKEEYIERSENDTFSELSQALSQRVNDLSIEGSVQPPRGVGMVTVVWVSVVRECGARGSEDKEVG